MSTFRSRLAHHAAPTVLLLGSTVLMFLPPASRHRTIRTPKVPQTGYNGTPRALWVPRSSCWVPAG